MQPARAVAALALALLLSALSAPIGHAQGAEDSDEFALLRQPGRTLAFGLPMPPYPHPADPVGVALLLSWRFPVSISETPPPERADFARGLETHMRDRATRHFARRIAAVGEMGVTEERLAEAANRGIVIEPASPQQIRLARQQLGPATLLGRIGAVARHVDAVFIAADRVTVHGENAGGVAFTSHHIALDISLEPGRFPLVPQRPGAGARRQLYNATHELGHLFWYALTDEQRSAFTDEFWPDGTLPSRTHTVSDYAATSPAEDFAECFVIACFYPRTFDTAPVLGQQVAPPRPARPLRGPALARVAHIDRLINEALAPPPPLNTLRDNRFSRMLASFKPNEDDESDEPMSPNLLDALSTNRDADD